jgi:sec-independent protein translocase protein TatA
MGHSSTHEESTQMTNMLGNILGPDGLIIIVALIVVMLFGGSKLPKLARGLGSASHEFRKGLEEGEKSTDTEEKNDKPPAGA